MTDENPLILPEPRPAPRRPTHRVEDGRRTAQNYDYTPKPPPPEPPTREQIEGIIRSSGTILGKTIPMCYGTAVVVGHIGAWEYTSPNLDLGIVFAYGEQDSIATATTKMNGEVITSATGVSSEGIHTGDGSTALSSILTNMTEWDADDTTKWQGMAHAVMRIDCRRAKLPGSFVFTSKLGGRKITPIGGGAAAVSSNLAVVGYDIMTNSDWAGVATARINETSWGLFEDWCDEVMGDASARYEFNGIVSERDPDAALKLVLGHGLAKPYVDIDGKLAIWAEMAPPHITGDWSATASATITEDATSGNAVAELTVDDYVYVGTNLRRVSSITDDDTVVLDSAVTVDGVRVRPISNVYIKKRDWITPTAASEASLLQTPDKYRVRFEDEDNLGSHEVTATYGAGTDKIIETTLPGCSSAAVATRHAETMLKVAHLQPYYWSGPVKNDIGTALEIGDVVLFDDDVLTMQPARVLPPLQARPDGTYVLQLREYDPAAYSSATAVTDTVPNLGVAFDSGDPPIMTQISTVYSNTEYDLIGMGTAGIYDGRVTVGDTARNTVIGSSDIRLPNNIPIYGLKAGGTTVQMLKMDTSDRLVVGDGAEAVYLNASTGGGILLPPDVPVVAGWSVASNLHMLRYVSGSNKIEVGRGAAGAPHMDIQGRPVELNSTSAAIPLTGYPQFNGITSYAGVPTTSNFAAGCWGIFRDTSGGATYLVYNRAGTIEKVALT